MVFGHNGLRGVGLAVVAPDVGDLVFGDAGILDDLSGALASDLKGDNAGDLLGCGNAARARVAGSLVVNDH